MDPNVPIKELEEVGEKIKNSPTFLTVNCQECGWFSNVWTESEKKARSTAHTISTGHEKILFTESLVVDQDLEELGLTE